MRRCCVARLAAAVKTTIAGPQFDFHGNQLPPNIAAVLSAKPAVSAKWITDDQLKKLFPSLDASTIQGPPVAVPLGANTLHFFNVAQLPNGASLALPLCHKPRLAASTALLPTAMVDALVAAAAARGFKSDYWLSAEEAAFFGTKIRAGEMPVATAGRLVPLKYTASPSEVLPPVTMHQLLFNADQTEHPERFTAEYCRRPVFTSIYGQRRYNEARSYIQAHVVVNKLPMDRVWSSKEHFDRFNIRLREDANPVTYCSEKGELVTLYGESMTESPDAVKRLAEDNKVKYARTFPAVPPTTLAAAAGPTTPA